MYHIKNLSTLFLTLISIALYTSCSKDDDNRSSGISGVSTSIVLTTTSASGINSTSVNSGGNITSDGGSSIIQRGVCWSTNVNPTIVDAHTTDGIGIGVFTSNISGLNPNTTYYVRSYASNSNITAYGNQISFTTANNVGGGGCSGGQTTVTDIDGNVYHVVSIGNQCWMKENLKTTRFRNGDQIAAGLTNTQWSNTTVGAWAYYDNNAQYNNPYGKLYNWYAVADSRGLCPIGWHVSTDYDFKNLIITLDNSADTSCNACSESLIVGGSLKATGDSPSGTGNWLAPNFGANNSSGFSAVGGGFKEMGGGYYDFESLCYLWTSTVSVSEPDRAYIRFLYYNGTHIWKNSGFKTNGMSVRCVRD